MKESEILQRITALEIEVGRIGNVIAGIRESITLAASAPALCGRCGESLSEGMICGDSECPSGFYKGEFEK